MPASWGARESGQHEDWTFLSGAPEDVIQSRKDMIGVL